MIREYVKSQSQSAGLLSKIFDPGRGGSRLPIVLTTARAAGISSAAATVCRSTDPAANTINFNRVTAYYSLDGSKLRVRFRVWDRGRYRIAFINDAGGAGVGRPAWLVEPAWFAFRVHGIDCRPRDVVAVRA